MAKYLVFSDSHGRNDGMLEVIEKYKKEVEGLFFLGDIEGGEDRLRGAIQGPTYIVRGNCDWLSQAPDFQVVKLHGHSVAMTHGHRMHVNGGVDLLKSWAIGKEADIVMYGHTHVPFLEQSQALTVLNPGSISRPRQEGYVRTYAIIDFMKNGEVRIDLCRVN